MDYKISWFWLWLLKVSKFLASEFLTSFNTNYNNASSNQDAEKSSGSSSYSWGAPSTIGYPGGHLSPFTQDHGSYSTLLIPSALLISIPLGSCLVQAKGTLQPPFIPQGIH